MTVDRKGAANEHTPSVALKPRFSEHGGRDRCWPTPENPILAVPQPVRRKKRVSRTVYWEECPSCSERITGWEQNTNDDPPQRRYKPCDCVVTASHGATP